MITFDVMASTRDLLEADPQVMKDADQCLAVIRAATCKPTFDTAEGEMIIHIPIKFVPERFKYVADIKVELKLKSTKKQAIPLAIGCDKETGEIIVHDPSVPMGQESLDL